jgi:xylan 1,4-beta-xylosidase
LFAAEGGTVFTHQEVVARSKTLDELSFEEEPDGPFITNIDTPDFYLQKQGHGALTSTPSGEWYYASLVARPWNHATESSHDPRGWSTLGRETSIQKVEWDDAGWPRVVGGHGGQVTVEAPKDAILTDAPKDHSQHDTFDQSTLDLNWNTLRQPFTAKLGTVGNGALKLVGQQSLSSTFDVSLVARRWQAFNFDAETKVKFDPFSYQQMAGLVNFYNDKHYSWIFITNDEQKGRVIEVAQNDNNHYTSFLKDQAIAIPAGTEFVWFKVKVRKESYTYQYSFDGQDWETVPVELDAAILSDDYVLQTSGGFFTGAFVGLAAVDYAGYEAVATFDHFDYQELPD